MTSENEGGAASAPVTQPQTSAPATPARKTKVKAKPAKKAKGKGPKASTAKGVKGPQVLRQYAPGYHKDKAKKTAGGHTSVDSNDALAQKLRGKDLDHVYKEAARILKEPESALRAKYKGLNVGMQRMNLGNRMRAATA